jgi:hypothetical protein
MNAVIVNDLFGLMKVREILVDIVRNFQILCFFKQIYVFHIHRFGKTSGHVPWSGHIDFVGQRIPDADHRPLQIVRKGLKKICV